VLPVDEPGSPEAAETAVVPLDETGPDTSVLGVDDAAADAADTTVLPVDDADPTVDEADVPAEAASAADEPEVVSLDTSTAVVDDTADAPGDTAVLPLDETRPLPTSAASPAEPAPVAASAPYTSPIGALYAPTDRPGGTDQVRTSAYGEPAGAAYAGYVEDRTEPVVAPADPTPGAPARRRLRVGTVVWGLVIAAIGVGLLAWAAGVAIDLQLAMIVLLAVAGTALLVGSIVSGARNARR